MQPLLDALRHRARKPFLAITFISLAATSGPVSAAPFYWDADTSTTGNDADGTGLGTSGTWDTSTSNWWNLASLGSWGNGGADQAVFSYAYPTLGLPVSTAVFLGEAINANSLTFQRSGYVLNGSTLTLAGTSPTLSATLGDSATISSQFLGTEGLTKTGGGSIRLTGSNSGLTGALSIANGTLIINSEVALPGTGAVSILTNNGTPSNTNQIGFTGGALMLDGTAGGFTFSRDVNLEGRGPIGDRSSAILSLGDNTLSGTITTGVSPLVPATFRNSRISSVNGTLNLSGALVTQGTAATTFVSFGGINSTGAANYNLSGPLSGTGSIEKSGAGTLFLNPSNTSGYTGTVRISGSSTGQQSSVRVTQASAGGVSIFGSSVGTGTSSAIELNGGILEFRSEGDLNFGAVATGRNVYNRTTGNIFTGPGAGGDGINGTTTLGVLQHIVSTTAATATTAFNGRNGFGVTFSSMTIDASTSTSALTNTLTNNLGGTLRFTGNITLGEGNTAARPRAITFSGNGNTYVQGSIIAGTDLEKTLNKSGSGNLTIQGTGTTVAGGANISGGSLTITDFRSIGNNSSAITLGNTTTTAANLIIGTATIPTSGGLTTSRPIVLNGTTAANSIYANQPGSNPVILNGAITKPIAGNATFNLGGSNTADNIINTGIPSLGTSGVTKAGSGTWVLAGANAYTGATTISNGTLKLKANAAVSTILPATNAVALGATNGFAGGTLEFVGQTGVNNVQTLGAVTYALAGANTIRVTPGAGGTASLTFANITTGGAGTLNIEGADFTNNRVTFTQVNAAAGSDGIVTRSIYWDGADFAYRQGGVLRAPNYGVDGVTATTALGPLTSASNNRLTGSISTNTISVATLKIDGGHTLTLNSEQTLTLSGGGLLATGGESTITGGTALALGAAALVARVNLSGDTLTINSPITGSGGLTKSGAGTLILGGASARTGATEIAEGTVRLSGSGTLSGANVTTNIRQLGTLDLNGVSTGTSIGGFSNMGVVENNSDDDATLTIGNAITTNGTAGTSYGIIKDGTGTGKINLTISTANNTAGQTTTFVLNGLSSYSGVTTLTKSTIGNLLVSANTLADIGQDSSIGRGDATNDTTNAQSLVFSGLGAELRYIGNILNGNLTLGSTSASTNRLFTVSGSSATLSNTASNNNAIIWSNEGAIVHGSNANRTLTLSSSVAADSTFNPQWTNSTGFVSSLTKTGTGQWNLGNSNNTYTGTTTVANGILALNQNGALSGDSPVVLGSTTTTGILQMSGTFARNLSATPVAGTGSITWGGTTGGGGFAAHATPLTVTLNGGAGLTWGTGGFVGTGGTQALVLSSTSALSDVTFTNAINLAGAARTVTVNDNTTTGADYATLSGAISGAAGSSLTKTGNGVLRLGSANTYQGTTQVSAGAVAVSRLGDSANPGASSVGDTTAGNTNAGAILLGNGATTGGSIQYTGAGEVSDRKIRLNTTTGTNQIHADGAGAIILTNVVNDLGLGNKTLSLRGNNTAGNMITSQLSDNGGTLAIGVDGGATWILTNGTNNYTGTTTVGAGALGIGHDTAIGAALTISNGNVFAYGGDRTLLNTLNLGNNASSGFIGDYNITFNGVNNLGAGANGLNLYNSVAPGKAITLNGLVANSLTANRSWLLDGSGETVVNGNFTTSTIYGVAIQKSGDGTLVLGTNGATSNWNQAGATIDIDRGTLRFSANEAIPTTAVTNGGLILSPEVATTDTATVDLNGTTQTVNALTATSNGTLVIDNTSATAATFRFGANNSVVNFGSGVGTYTVQNTGAGALSLVKLGNTATSFISGITLAHKGITASEGGGSFSIASPVTATTGLRAIEASSLSLTGGLPNGNLISSVEVGGGSTLSLLDGAGSQMTNLTTLNLGNTGSGNVTLNLNVGDLSLAGDGLQTDTFSLLTGGTLNLGNTIIFNLTDAGLNANTTYTLINVVDGGLTSGPLSAGNWSQGATPGGFDALTWFVDNNVVQLTTGNLLLNDLYWRGATDSTWNANVNNWSLNKDGSGLPDSIPGQGNKVIFAYDGAGSGALATTLEQNFKINSLVFESGATTPSSVAINPGALATARLEIAPQNAADGIAITTGGSPAVTLATNLKIGTNQTWNVVDSGSVLTLSGSLFGEADVTKSGAGRVVLSGVADPTFNAGQTTDLTVTAGNLELTNAAALGTLANSNLANIDVSGGGFYYNNATGGTILNALTLSGGTLSAGRGGATAAVTHTYSGAVNVSASSFVNLRDLNSATTTTSANNITLSGVLSGSGNLTVSSDDAVGTRVGGNAELGAFTINNSASTWSGDLIIKSGSVDITAAASPTVTPGDITFDGFGRLIVRGVNGQTITRATDTLTFLPGSIGEVLLDNSSSVLASDFIINQNGQVNLGSGGAGATARFTVNDAASQYNIGGAVVLGGNSSISVDGGDADSFITITGIISDGGSGYSLAINDDAGGWAVTNDIIRLTGLNTFSGNVNLSEGVLEFDSVTNIGGAASSLGQGNALTVGAANLRFIGTTSQSTNRPITQTGSSTYSANGTAGVASITYAGAISAGGSNFTLSGAAGSEGFITGGISQTGDTADATVNGGTWTISGAGGRVADTLTVSANAILNLSGSSPLFVRNDVIVTGTNSVLNLNSTNALNFSTATLSADASLRAYTGGVITLGANDAIFATDFDGLRIGVDGAGVGTLNMGSFNQTTNEFILGNRNLDRSGIVNGTGTLTVTGNFDVYDGTINSNLASSGTGTLDKLSLGTVTLAGDNSGLASTGATVINEGTLILDYTANNGTKLRAASQLEMRGANLILNGNAGAATSQSVGSFTLGNGGSAVITLNPGAGQDLVLNLNAITRAINAQDGTVRFVLPAGTQSATNGITTDTLNTIGTAPNAILGAWATVNDGSGTFFARNFTNAADGNIVAAVTTNQDAIASWLTGENISDVAGFTGTVTGSFVNSLRFNAATGSALTLGAAGVLGVNSGGILVTNNVTGDASISAGTLFSGTVAATPELVVTQDSASLFEINSDIRTNHIVFKAGAGTLLLSGNNVYTGLTEIQNGTLQLSGGNAIGDTSLVTLSANRASTLELLNDETIGRLQGGSRQTDQDLGIVAIGSNTLTINQSGNTTFSGFFTGDGSIVLNTGSTGNLNMNNVSSAFTGSVVINSGLFQLSGVGRNDASSFTINNAGNLLLDKNGTSGFSSTQILDTAGIALNSAIGTAAQPGGLWIRRNATGAVNETVGVVSANSGNSYIRAEQTATDAITVLSASNVTRNNSATLTIRGSNMANTSLRRAQFRIIAANEAAFIASMVGDSGAAGTATTSIVPWAVGEDVGNVAVAATNMGNSLVTYTATTGFRPLNLTTEYASFGSAGARNNTRESLTGDLLLQSGRTLNSLVINNQAVTSVTLGGAGADNGLINTSGAFLFTVTSGTNDTAYGITLNGFDDGISAPGGEYIFHVVNPSHAATTPQLTATVSSILTSASDITKSGRGTLVLDQINTAGGGLKKTTINEGTLEIGDLDNIGGDTGGLVFAGGTLRLGSSYGSDDLTLRAISFLTGGGTLDTASKNPVFAGSLGSGVGGFTKTGAGNLTLNGSATYTGASFISLGTVTVGANNALGNGGNLTLAAGTTLAFSGTNTLNHGLVTTSGASPQITGTGTINASTGFAFNHTGDTAISAILGGAGGLLKTQANILALNGLNTYTGTTEIQNGGVIFNSIANVGGGASSFGAPTSVENGIIRVGLTTAVTTLNYTGSGHTSNRLIGLQGTTGAFTLDADGTGALVMGGIRSEMAGNKTITLRGSSDAALENGIGEIREIGGVISIVKTDANTWAYHSANIYTGNTTVDNGILRLKAVQNLTGALQFGSAGTITTTGTVEAMDDAAFGSLLVQPNGAANLVIDPTKVVTINGNVVIGSATSPSVTNFTASGGGDFAVTNLTNTGNTFHVGGTGTGNVTVADFSALASMNVSLNPASGTMLISSSSSTNATGKAELRLADDTTITANALTVGGGGTFGGVADQVNLLKLGTTSNTLNVNALNIGTGARDLGSITFLDTTGTVTVRAADGTSSTAFNMGTGSATTAVALAGNQNTFDVTGHTADLKFSTVNIGTQNRGADLANVFSFDTGTLEMGSLVASTKGSGVGTTTTTINLGGGTVTTGAWTLATASGAGTAVATANLTGGNITFSGAITRGADAVGGGTATGTVNLNGAVLDMGGNAIGTSTNQIVFNAQSGTLRNLSELNGGGTLNKTTAGTLLLDTSNSYTGATTVSAGVLQVSNGGALGGVVAGTTVADGAVLELSGNITTTNEALTLNGSGISDGGALRSTSGDNTYAGNITLATASRINSDAGLLTLDATTGAAVVSTDQTLTLGGAGDITVADAVNLGTGGLVKDGAGTVILSGDNNYSGTTTVSGGLLQINGDSSLATGAVSVASGATLGGSGTIGGLASTATIASGGILTGGSDGSTSGSPGVLDPLVTDAVDSLSFGGSLTAASGSIWLVDLVQGGVSDLISVGGALDITGANFVINFGGAFVVDQVYTIATYGSGLTGNFAGLSEGAFVDPGNLYRINYGSLGAGGAITLTAVPEPGTLGFLGLALSGFLVRRIRRRLAAAATVSQ